MLELHISDTDVTSGSIPISWCVDKETLLRLAQDGATDPYILFAIKPKDNYSRKKELRKIVPLKDLIAYIDFKCSGENEIHGFITYSKSFAKEFLERNNFEYGNNLFLEDGKLRKKIFILESIYPIQKITYEELDEQSQDLSEKLFATPLHVDVPKEAFAKEPAEWEQRWVNHMFRSKPYDQCNYRRRRMFAYGVQPIIILTDIFSRFLFCLAALFFGARKFTISNLLHPLDKSFIDSFDMFEDGTIFLKTPVKKFTDVARFIFFPPLVLLLTTIHYFHLWIYAERSAIIVIILTTIILLLTGFITGVLSAVIKKLYNRIPKFNKHKKDDQAWFLDEQEMDLIICNGEKKPLKVSQLPSKHRTFKLRFQDLKSKVCRPFSA